MSDNDWQASHALELKPPDAVDRGSMVGMAAHAEAVKHYKKFGYVIVIAYIADDGSLKVDTAGNIHDSAEVMRVLNWGIQATRTQEARIHESGKNG